jgi:hypothetical protein
MKNFLQKHKKVIFFVGGAYRFQRNICAWLNATGSFRGNNLLRNVIFILRDSVIKNSSRGTACRAPTQSQMSFALSLLTNVDYYREEYQAYEKEDSKIRK